MNGFIEQLSRLNENGHFGDEHTGGCAPLVTVQDKAGAMAGTDRVYSEFVMNIVHKHPTSREAREQLLNDCIKAHRDQEANVRKLFKEKTPLTDDACEAIGNMAIDWLIQGFHNETEAATAKLAAVYLSKNVPVTTWIKKYETAFVNMLTELHDNVNRVCNQAKQNTGIYE